ncbi:CD3324 family protein [Anaerocolumna sp. AGMB13025]|uniref:CD3324 family protein n=1 Tax=Anaerocolumna sp. AGMB13025 TaxID=3039116 RepID=UPI00241D02E1|nr:CD3324 family protein [Anaerocolumna sp. AGMB13025]WFR59476.1 CD3324 family protein [Anaerocolumna sp. AGMB13025]
MKYINALNVIPDELLFEIRKYIPEGFLYIPGRDKRKDWGSISGQKMELTIRNRAIFMNFQDGKTVVQLSKEHYLSESSIYRILKNFK